jgi:hypothetical protein
MTVAPQLIVDPLPPFENRKQLASWYAQGHSDGLGDRLLMFDNTTAPSWEILRFKPALARDSRFGDALRERMQQLSSFQHPAFPRVDRATALEQEGGLAVVSTYISGVRLAEALHKPRSPAFAVQLIRQLMPALVALHRHAPGIAHGALDADHIVVTGASRLRIREHMVGSALESLGLSAERLWSDFGIVVSPRPTPAPTLDDRNDVMQLALVAVSLMAGRRIGPDEFPGKVNLLLDEVAHRSSRQALVVFEPLRRWLERALEVDGPMFDSALAANEAVAELWDEGQPPDQHFGFLGLAAAHRALHATGQPRSDGRPTPAGAHPNAPMAAPERVELAVPERAALPAPAHPDIFEHAPAPAPLPLVENAAASPGRRAEPSLARDRGARDRQWRWAATAAVAVAAAEAVFIGWLLTELTPTLPPAAAALSIESSQPGAAVWVDDKPAGFTPLQLNVERIRSIRVLPAAVVADTGAPRPTDIPAVAEQKQPQAAASMGTAGTLAPRAAPPRTGGFRISSPIELHVLAGEQVLGSSKDGPIVASAGRHELEFVNNTIGYRVRQIVDVKAGVIGSLSITPPNGVVNINAVPWASVWIDGNPIGETPIGNFSVAPGEHEVVFRHPQLGERRQRTIVRSDGVTRVTANLQR